MPSKYLNMIRNDICFKYFSYSRNVRYRYRYNYIELLFGNFNDVCCRYGYYDLLKMYPKNISYENLHTACVCGHNRIAKFILSEYFNIPFNINFCIHLRCCDKHYNFVKKKNLNKIIFPYYKPFQIDNKEFFIYSKEE